LQRWKASLTNFFNSKLCHGQFSESKSIKKHIQKRNDSIKLTASCVAAAHSANQSLHLTTTQPFFTFRFNAAS
jgi:hypothetical protein